MSEEDRPTDLDEARAVAGHETEPLPRGECPGCGEERRLAEVRDGERRCGECIKKLADRDRTTPREEREAYERQRREERARRRNFERMVL